MTAPIRLEALPCAYHGHNDIAVYVSGEPAAVILEPDHFATAWIVHVHRPDLLGLQKGSPIHWPFGSLAAAQDWLGLGMAPEAQAA